MKIGVIVIFFLISSFGSALESGEGPALKEQLRNNAALRASGILPRLPLSFEAIESGRKFISRGPIGALTLSPQSAVWNFKRAGQKSPLRMSFVGANATPLLEGLEPLQTRTNYLIGNDSAQWRTEIANYGKVRYEQLWPGVDVVYYGTQEDHEFDFVVDPKADPSLIRFRFEHAGKFILERNGDLLLKSDGGDVRLRKPVLYQQVGKEKRMVEGSFAIRRKRGFVEVGFRVGRYDRSRRLVIDPVVTFASFLGSYYADLASAVKVDAQGFIYVAGSTSSYNFPTTPGAFQTAQVKSGGCSGPEPHFNLPCSSAFITKITPSGNALVYSTYLGGDLFNYAEAIAVDAQGQVYVVGSTDARNFPVTTDAWQRTRRGSRNAFITKLNASGTGLIYSTYLGGSNLDWAYDVKIDEAGQAYVCGATNSSDFPVTSGAAQTVFNGGELLNDFFGEGFVVKLNAAGSGAVYSTLIGGKGREVAYSLALDPSGGVTVAGMTGSRDFPVTPDAIQTSVANLKPYDTDAFVARINPAGAAFTYATLIGADGSEEADVVAVNPAGEIYLFGITNSEEFPVTPNAIQKNLSLLPTDYSPPKQDCFILRLNPSTKTLIYSTYLGGRFEEQARGMVIDDAGFAYLTGFAFSPDFPTTPGENQHGTDAFLTKVHPSGDYLVYSLTIGGMAGEGYTDSGFDITRDQAGRIYIAGTTESPTFPVVNPGQLYAGGTSDAFILKAEDTVPAGADMTLRINRAGAFSVNQPGAYLIRVLNLGSQASNGTITIKDALPVGLSFVSATAADWGCAAEGQEVTCTTQKIFAPQDSSLIRINVAIGAQATPAVSNTATLSYNNDSVTQNNVARDDAFVAPICSYTLFPAAKTIYRSVGGESFGVRAPIGCRFHLRPQVPWIHITNPVRDIGVAQPLATTINFDVDEYRGGESRTGTIMIEDAVFTVTQVKQTVSLNAASYAGDRLGQGSIAAMFGNGLATATAVATSQPLPTSLAGTTVKYLQGDVEYPAQLFFVSPTQINYLVPKDIYPSDITVVVTSGDGSKSGGTVNLGLPAPGLFSANANGQGVAAAVALRVRPGNVQSFEPVGRYDAGLKQFVPLPIDLGSEDEQVYLILFGTGIFNPLAPQFPIPVKIGGLNATVSFVGRQGDFAGLDQVNVLLPRGLIGRGEVDIELGVDIGAAFPISYANKVKVQIK